MAGLNKDNENPSCLNKLNEMKSSTETNVFNQLGTVKGHLEHSGHAL